MATIFMALSGGIDSTVLLANLLSEGYKVTTCFFKYGSKHNEREELAANEVTAYYKVKGSIVDMTDIFDTSSSALLARNMLRPIPPTGYQEVGSLAATVVPGRNTVFASALASFAEAEALQSEKTTFIALGIHGGDHALYPDCRPQYADALAKLIHISTEGRVGFMAPMVHWTKAKIVESGIALSAPLHLTWSCYEGKEAACGKCGTCRERLAAFESAGVRDPIAYAG